MKLMRLFFCFFILACSSQRPEKIRLIETSSQKQPEWILKKKPTDNNYYFVGIGKKNEDIQLARKSAIDDAISRLAEFIGFRVTTKFKSVKETTDTGDSSTFKEEIMRSIEGKSSASVATEVEDVYYERYTDGYQFYILLKSPVKWVENERKRLKKLIEDQRELAFSYLKQARNQFEAGEVAKAIDNTIAALLISERAEENSDIYLEAKDFLLIVISSIRFSLLNSPMAIYREGGSDEIQVIAKTTKNYKPVAGLLVEVSCDDEHLTFLAKKGLQTDEKGIVAGEVNNEGSTRKEAVLSFSFSMKRFEEIKEIDEELYKSIKKYQEMLKLSLKLDIKDRYKAIPSAIVIIDFIEGRNNFLVKFQEEVAGSLANMGFNVSTVDLSGVLKRDESPEKLKNSIISFINKEKPEIKNLILIYRNLNYLGELGKDIKFSDYDLNDSEIKVYELQTSINIINLETKESEKGWKFSVRGNGLNKTQAIEVSEKKFIEKLKEIFD
ncbi:MAG: hypothetical protein ACP5QT_02205 [Brevinematia bacterium]